MVLEAIETVSDFMVRFSSNLLFFCLGWIALLVLFKLILDVIEKWRAVFPPLPDLRPKEGDPVKQKGGE